MKKQILFIINPVAGVRKKHRIPDKIERFLDHEQFTYDIIYTQGRGHATEIAAEAAAKGVDVVAIAGGDGSVNEAASGLVGTETALAIIPLGSGNGLARHLGYSQWVRSTLEVINSYKVEAIDVGQVNGAYFFNVIGVGFDAYVAKLFDREKSRGLYTYAFASFYALFGFSSFEFELETPLRKEAGTAFAINICNSNQFGNDFKIAPDASVVDGQFQVVLTEDFPRWKAPSLLYKIGTENHLLSPVVRYFQANSIKIKTPRHAYLQIDGETHYKKTEFDITLIPEKLKVLVNPTSHI